MVFLSRRTGSALGSNHLPTRHQVFKRLKLLKPMLYLYVGLLVSLGVIHAVRATIKIVADPTLGWDFLFTAFANTYVLAAFGYFSFCFLIVIIVIVFSIRGI